MVGSFVRFLSLACYRIPLFKADVVKEDASVKSVAARKKGGAGSGPVASAAPGEDNGEASDEEGVSDSEDDEEDLGDEGALDGEEDAELCEKAGEKKARVRHERQLFKYLFADLTEEQKTLVEESEKKAAKVAEGKEKVASADPRGITWMRAENAALAFKEGRFPCKLYSSCEKYDGKLYGIIVDGDGAKGTRVHVESEARSGVVSSVAIGDDSNSLYTIRWDDGSNDSIFNTPEVLLYAVDGQKVVSLENDKLMFRRWLCGALVAVYAHGYPFLIQDRNKNKHPRPGVELGTVQEARAKIIRDFVWGEVKGLRASETVNYHEKHMISSDLDLVDNLDKAGSFLEMLELPKSPVGLLKEHNMGFDKKQHKFFVEHMLRGAQESWKLGRYSSLASFITPVAAGGDRVEFPRGLGSVCNDRTELKLLGKVAGRYGLGTRTMLAPAFNGKEGDDERRYIWLKHVPLYVLGQLTRPSHLGTIRVSSEHSRYVSPTQKNPTFFKFASRFSSTHGDDYDVQRQIYESYSLVSAQKRDGKADIENCDPQLGKGRKHMQGRLDRDLTPEQKKKQVKLAIEISRTNGVTPLLKHVRPEEIKKCWGILEAHEKYWTAKNEDHLWADWVEDVVGRLITAGVTRQMVSLFSLAFATMDRLTSSVRRSQCMLRCLASTSHVFEGCPRDMVNKDNKTYTKSIRHAKGADVHHKKSIHVADIFVVLIVICRPLMRKLLQQRADELANELDELKAKPMVPRETPAGREKRINKLCKRVEEARGKKLGETTGPFDEDGRSLCEKAYNDLLRFVGVRCFGIPNWGAHIARTEHITLVHGDAVKKGMPVDHPDVSQVGWSAGHNGESQLRHYDNERNRDGGSGFVQGHGGILQSLEFVTEEPGGTSPPSTELPPVTGDPLMCCFFQAKR